VPFVEEYLALQVRGFYRVRIDERESAETGFRERDGSRTAQRSHADDQSRSGGRQRRLRWVQSVQKNPFPSGKEEAWAAVPCLISRPISPGT
jgi:hypothetical protein